MGYTQEISDLNTDYKQKISKLNEELAAVQQKLHVATEQVQSTTEQAQTDSAAQEERYTQEISDLKTTHQTIVTEMKEELAAVQQKLHVATEQVQSTTEQAQTDSAAQEERYTQEISDLKTTHQTKVT